LRRCRSVFIQKIVLIKTKFNAKINCNIVAPKVQLHRVRAEVLWLNFKVAIRDLAYNNLMLFFSSRTHIQIHKYIPYSHHKIRISERHNNRLALRSKEIQPTSSNCWINYNHWIYMVCETDSSQCTSPDVLHQFLSI